ncbi:hypothetical protein CTKZ_23760 [Cellulomonas algicola]|uniref:Uncharacterized protein n=1 Tax=Cellulomonas algicola TaxID=2071633 RepID=A0A401V1N6_9CELL|nr:hypothetical protein CTKZ_23760 [Cellulomonas algicola]
MADAAGHHDPAPGRRRAGRRLQRDRLDFNAIAGDDGVDRDLGDEQTWNGVAQVASPGGQSCIPSMLSVDTAFDPAAWRAAGRTAEGLRVLVPVAGGNERSRAVRAWHEAEPWMWDGVTDEDVTGAVVSRRRVGTDQAFLAANALFAVEHPDGERPLGMIPSAASQVFADRSRGRCVAPDATDLPHAGLAWGVMASGCSRGRSGGVGPASRGP